MPSVLLNQENVSINTVYCIGRTYVEHINELNNPIPNEPLVFLKPNSSIVMGDTLTLPHFSDNIHYETELVLLMGDNRQILGQAVGLDLTARDVQDICKQKGLPWLKAKGFKGACWLGDFAPFKNTTHHLSLTINGDIRQNDTTDKMMYSLEYLVNYLDNLYGLTHGDIIMTGTPKGVGRLERGDKLVVGLDDERYELLVM